MNPPDRHPRTTDWLGQSGVSLLEVTIVAAIMAVIAMIGVPMYQSSLETARKQKAQQELIVISQAIDSFALVHERLPLSLAEVGHGGRLDPWGVPYTFLNYEVGTGDGLDWAINAGLVDPAALLGGSGGPGSASAGAGTASSTSTSSSSTGTSTTGSASGTGSTKSAIGTTVSSSASTLSGTEVAELVRSIKDGSSGKLPAGFEGLTQSLVGQSIYVGIETNTVRRRDRYLFPLNTDYDLFSLGPNGRTAVALGDTMANDDVIRANDGGYFGSASDY